MPTQLTGGSIKKVLTYLSCIILLPVTLHLPKNQGSLVLVKLFKWKSAWPCCCQTRAHCRWYFSGFLKEKLLLSLAPINCAKWPITSGPCNRKLHWQTERRRRNPHLNGKLPMSGQCKLAHHAGLGKEGALGPQQRCEQLLYLLSYVSSFPSNVFECDTNPSLCSRLPFIKTDPHLSPLALYSHMFSLVPTTLKIR